jgi:tRNA threonylcarbamoyladenosine biosynthesis protein TsaE
MATHISRSPEETVALGRAFAESIKPGSIIGLKGDLGAGKTQFVRGLAAGLGSPDRVHSPTFALLNVYESGRIPLFHIDLYRLETKEAIHSSGLGEYFHQTDGVTVIEWYERLENLGFKIAHHLFNFETVSETERKITNENPRS